MSFAIITLCYIDPGSGSMLLQILLAGLVGMGVFFRSSITRLFGWIGNGRKRKSNQ